MLATEAAKDTQRADLENHLKTSQNALEDKGNELSKVKLLLEQVHHSGMCVIILVGMSVTMELKIGLVHKTGAHDWHVVFKRLKKRPRTRKMSF